MSMSSDGANVIVSIADCSGVGVEDSTVDLAQAVSATPHNAPTTNRNRRRRAARVMRLFGRVDRSRETLTQRGVTADDRIPGQLHAVAASLRHDFDAFWRNRNGEHLPFVFKLALDALVEFCRHGSK